jgi:hypothetical protein
MIVITGDLAIAVVPYLFERDIEPDQFLHQSPQTLGSAVRVARLEHNAAAVDESDLRQALADAAQGLAVGACRSDPDVAEANVRVRG